MKKAFIISILLMFLRSVSAIAFTIDEIDYSKTSETTVKVVKSTEPYSGNIILPSGVTYDSRTYSVTSIDKEAFSNCSGLTGITIPSSVTSIDDRAFIGCSDIRSIEVDTDNPNYASASGVLYNKQNTVLIAFPAGKSGIYTIPSSVTSIGNSAFFRCSGLTEITIPSSVTEIESWAFYCCSGLKSIIIPSSVTSIANGTFFGCRALKSVAIPSSVTSIGVRAFFKCETLRNITIPSSVTSIGDEAFSSCSGMRSINVDEDNPNYTCMSGVLYNNDKTSLIICPGKKTGHFVVPSSVISISDMAFSCGALRKVTIPSSVESIGSMAFSNCDRLKRIEVDESNPNYSTLSGVLYNKQLTDLIAYPSGKAGYFIIPSTVTSIGNWAFSHCHKLKEIIIPSSLTFIGEWAFIHCSDLERIMIPSSVNSIGVGAFSNCINLTTIYSDSEIPIDLSLFVYYNIDKTNCKLFVPIGSRGLYEEAKEWKDFPNIIESDEAEIFEIR